MRARNERATCTGLFVSRGPLQIRDLNSQPKFVQLPRARGMVNCGRSSRPMQFSALVRCQQIESLSVKELNQSIRHSYKIIGQFHQSATGARTCIGVRRVGCMQFRNCSGMSDRSRLAQVADPLRSPPPNALRLVAAAGLIKVGCEFPLRQSVGRVDEDFEVGQGAWFVSGSPLTPRLAWRISSATFF